MRNACFSLKMIEYSTSIQFILTMYFPGDYLKINHRGLLKIYKRKKLENLS